MNTILYIKCKINFFNFRGKVKSVIYKSNKLYMKLIANIRKIRVSARKYSFCKLERASVYAIAVRAAAAAEKGILGCHCWTFSSYFHLSLTHVPKIFISADSEEEIHKS